MAQQNNVASGAPYIEEPDFSADNLGLRDRSLTDTDQAPLPLPYEGVLANQDRIDSPSEAALEVWRDCRQGGRGAGQRAAACALSGVAAAGAARSVAEDGVEIELSWGNGGPDPDPTPTHIDRRDMNRSGREEEAQRYRGPVIR